MDIDLIITDTGRAGLLCANTDFDTNKVRRVAYNPDSKHLKLFFDNPGGEGEIEQTLEYPLEDEYVVLLRPIREMIIAIQEEEVIIHEYIVPLEIIGESDEDRPEPAVKNS